MFFFVINKIDVINLNSWLTASDSDSSANFRLRDKCLITFNGDLGANVNRTSFRFRNNGETKADLNTLIYLNYNSWDKIKGVIGISGTW